MPSPTQKRKEFSPATVSPARTAVHTLQQLRQFREYAEFKQVTLPPVQPQQPKKEPPKPAKPAKPVSPSRLSLRSLIDETKPRIVRKPSSLGVPTIYRSFSAVNLPNVSL